MSIDAGLERPRAMRLLSILGLSFRAQWIFFAVPVLYLASNTALMWHLEPGHRASVLLVLGGFLGFTLPVGMLLMLVMRLACYAAVLKPASPLRALAFDLAALFTRPRLLINALPVFTAMVLFNSALVELKPAIPLIHPFDWDVRLMELDRALHFGVDPWRIVQPVLGFGVATFAVNIAYNFWFLALIGTWFWFGFQSEASVLRTRFFLAYMLAWWLGGGLLAVLFSSAGPVYYGRLGLSPDPYVPLFAYLNDVDTRIPLWFLDAQQLLWDGYTGKAVPVGISAMPSMHNASATLFALALGQISRRLGWVFAAYAGVILVGSVHLGWHYAVDGYAGVLIGLVCWWAMGPIARWAEERPLARRYNEGLASL